MVEIINLTYLAFSSYMQDRVRGITRVLLGGRSMTEKRVEEMFLDAEELKKMNPNYSKEYARLALLASIRTEMYELALQNGVEDNSYHTVCYGGVPSYCGSGKITFRGKTFIVTGFASRGNALILTRDGYIEFKIAEGK